MDTEAAPGRDPAPPKNPLAKVAGHLLGLISRAARAWWNSPIAWRRRSHRGSS